MQSAGQGIPSTFFFSFFFIISLSQDTGSWSVSANGLPARLLFHFVSTRYNPQAAGAIEYLGEIDVPEGPNHEAMCICLRQGRLSSYLLIID